MKIKLKIIEIKIDPLHLIKILQKVFSNFPVFL